MRHRFGFVPVLVLLTVAACGGTEQPGSAVTVRDSAGVTIVENSSPLWAPGEEWIVSREAKVVIGTANGPLETQLFGVVGATRLPDGRIVIANAGTNTVRIFDPQGHYLNEVGGLGEGPGEFVRLAWLHRFTGDSLLVFDSRLHRLSVLDEDGSFIRAFTLARVVAFPEFPIAGSRVMASTRNLVPREQLQTGVNTDSTTVVVFSMDGAPLDTVGRFPTPETFLWVDGQNMLVIPLPFPRAVMVAPSLEGFYFGSSDAYDIRAYTHGGVVARIRRRHVARQASHADIQRFITDVLADARTENHRRQLERIYGEISYRTSVPAFSDIKTDGAGYLWVKGYTEKDAETAIWDVFRKEGRWLGSVELPARLDVYEIGTNYVLGKSEDQLGIEVVRLHRLMRHE